MGFRDELNEDSKQVYVKSYTMPANVGFRILRVTRTAGGKEESNVLYLKYKDGFDLMIWGDKKIQEFTEADVNYFNEALKSESWYLITFGKVGNHFPVKVVDKDGFARSTASIFEADKHDLNFDAEPPECVKSFDSNKKRKL